MTMATLAQEFHDIVPPLDYSLIPAWVIFVASALALSLIGLLIWYALKFLRREEPVRSPRDRALDALDTIEATIENTPPYQFSIHVSDILRRYVVDQFDLPMTRQTSVEFLNAIGSAPKFSEDEKALLADFLNRCDLINFARLKPRQERSAFYLMKAGGL